MKEIGKRWYLVLAILIMSVPLRVNAAEQDAVILRQEGNKVAVCLEMGNAAAENITAASVSLGVKIEGGEAEVDFEFAVGAANAEVEQVYHDGKLDLYVVMPAAGDSLFQGDRLELGYVRVTPKDSSQMLEAEISCEDGFKTANGSYGDRKPLVEETPEPVRIEVNKEGDGGTTSPSTPPDDGNGDSGNGSSGSGDSENGSQGSGSGDSNIDEGLYDENTQFVNDPSNAQIIPAPIIKNINQPPELVDLSKAPVTEIAGKRQNGSSGNGSTEGVSAKGKVSVIGPADGPSSILIAQNTDKASGTEGEEEIQLGEAEDESAEKAAESGFSDEGNTEEIRLDQKNGGVVSSRKSEGSSWLAVLACVVAAVIAVAGVAVFVIVKKRRQDA